MVKYQLYDWQGYICWLKRNDGVFLVDPIYFEDFKKEVIDFYSEFEKHLQSSPELQEEPQIPLPSVTI